MLELLARPTQGEPPQMTLSFPTAGIDEGWLKAVSERSEPSSCRCLPLACAGGMQQR